MLPCIRNLLSSGSLSDLPSSNNFKLFANSFVSSGISKHSVSRYTVFLGFVYLEVINGFSDVVIDSSQTNKQTKTKNENEQTISSEKETLVCEF